MMTDSQEKAKIIAYETAGATVDYEYHGALVTSIIEGMPASELLETGDRIVALDGEPIETAEQLIDSLTDKSSEETVHLTIERDEQTEVIEIGFSPFPESFQLPPERTGIGLSNPVTDRDVTFEPETSIETKEIGGPSAGLMFSLEIYNQLIDENMKKGYQIAGTGTIDEEGNVGPIGGAGLKVLAADKAGAEVFFCS